MSLARNNDSRGNCQISGGFPSPRPSPGGRGERAGYTLVEMLIVVSILLIFAGLVIPSSNQTSYDQLLSAARVLASDLAYARGLAVTNNDQYTVTFSGSGNSYTLQYSGTNPALVNLPITPFRSPTDPPSQQIQRLADLPEVTAPVNLVAAADVGAALMTAVNNVQFNALGGTTRSDPTWIWLACGTGSSRCYLVVTVNPVTGLTSIGACTGSVPSNSLLLAADGPRQPAGKRLPATVGNALCGVPPGLAERRLPVTPVGWDKAALAAAGPPKSRRTGGPALAPASWSHPTDRSQRQET